MGLSAQQLPFVHDTASGGPALTLRPKACLFARGCAQYRWCGTAACHSGLHMPLAYLCARTARHARSSEFRIAYKDACQQLKERRQRMLVVEAFGMEGAEAAMVALTKVGCGAG